MPATFDDLKPQFTLLNLSDSLGFLNRLLGVARGDRADPPLQRILQTYGQPVPVFLCQFFAKQIVLHGSDVAPYSLDWSRFRRLADLYFALEDPIQSQPGWKEANPTAFFERLLGQQLAPQHFYALREFGLGTSLFQESPAFNGFDLPAECRRVLSVPVDLFMQLGFLCWSASRRGRGMVTKSYLGDAWKQGFKAAEPTIVEAAFKRIACTPDQFREYMQSPRYQIPDDRYASSQFNPLVQYPLIEVRPGRYVAPDPQLLIERTTWGIFFDLLAEGGRDFTGDFGHAFGALIGRLLESVLPKDLLWSDSVGMPGPNQEPSTKKADWAYKGTTNTVLIECKSLRPTLKLTTEATDDTVESAARRVAEALQQLHGHDESIQRGEWINQGLHPGPTSHVVATYGRFTTMNGPFFRPLIHEQLKKLGVPPRPFVVLSLQEFDSVISLVDQGMALDKIATELLNTDSFDVLHQYREQLGRMAISNYSHQRTHDLLEQIRPLPLAP